MAARPPAAPVHELASAPWRVHTLLAAVHEPGRELRDVVVEAFTTLRGVRHDDWRVAVLAIWAVGIVLDTVSTGALLSRPGFVEANPVAAGGMGLAGTAGYLGLTCLMSSAWALVAASPTRGAYAEVVSGVAVALGIGKLAVGTHNLLLCLFG
jgi:hypothetical protein